MLSFPSRRAKKLAASFLPEAVKAPLRGRLFGFRPAAVDLPAVFSVGHRGPLLTIDGRYRMRFREEDRSDVQFHFVTNGESIEEMAGFLGLASSARSLFDVGAAKSIFSILFCLTSTSRRAYAFEPSPRFLADGAALAELNSCVDRISQQAVAVGRESGRLSGRLLDDGFASLDPAESRGKPLEIAIMSLDEAVEQLGVVPDLVKIDVEGHEHEVLAGAGRLLRTRKPALSIELHLNQLDRRGVRPVQVVDDLVSLGYRFRNGAGRELRPSQIAQSMNAIVRFIAQ